MNQYIFLPLNGRYMQFLKELTDEFGKLFWQEIKITKLIVFAVKLTMLNGLKIEDKISKSRIFHRGTRENDLHFHSRQ